MIWESFGAGSLSKTNQFLPTSAFSTGGSIDVNPPTVDRRTLVGSTAWSGGDYSIPVGDSGQLAPLAWNNLDQVRIVFSDDVDVVQGDLVPSPTSTTSTYGFVGLQLRLGEQFHGDLVAERADRR